LLSEFKSVERLDLSVNPMTCFVSISHLNKVKSLRLLGTSIDSKKHYPIFTHLESLEFLDLDSCSNVVSISGLESAEKLRSLVLSLTKIRDLSDCGVFENIRTLELSCCDNFDVSKLNQLEKIVTLENLDLSCVPVMNLVNINRLTKLKKLDLRDCSLTKITNLESFDVLEELNIGHNSIAKIECLESAKNLVSLNLTNYLNESDEPLKKIEGLDHLKKLQKLVLAGHEISVLASLPTDSLEYVDVTYNHVHDIDYQWLNSIVNQCLIKLTGNPIKLRNELVPEHIKIEVG